MLDLWKPSYSPTYLVDHEEIHWRVLKNKEYLSLTSLAIHVQIHASLKNVMFLLKHVIIILLQYRDIFNVTLATDDR